MTSAIELADFDSKKKRLSFKYFMKTISFVFPNSANRCFRAVLMMKSAPEIWSLTDNAFFEGYDAV